MKIAKWYQPEMCVSKPKDAPQTSHPYLDVAAQSLISTDGHRLVKIPVKTEKGEVSGHIACDLLKIARKKAGKDLVEAEIRERREVVPHQIEWPIDGVLGEFPDWRQVLPRFRPGDDGTITIGLNARLLKGIADALGSSGHVALTVRLDSLNLDMPPREAAAEGLEPQILVRSTFARDGELGVLMPIRLDDEMRGVTEVPEDADEKERREAIEREANVFLKANGSGELVDPELSGEPVKKVPPRRG